MIAKRTNTSCGQRDILNRTKLGLNRKESLATVYSILANAVETRDSSNSKEIAQKEIKPLPHQSKNGRIMERLVKFEDRGDPG